MNALYEECERRLVWAADTVGWSVRRGINSTAITASAGESWLSIYPVSDAIRPYISYRAFRDATRYGVCDYIRIRSLRDIPWFADVMRELNVTPAIRYNAQSAGDKPGMLAERRVRDYLATEDRMDWIEAMYASGYAPHPLAGWLLPQRANGIT